MKNSTVTDMTNGPFFRKIVLFSVPLVFTGLLQLVYNTADTVIVGRFAGKQALAAVGSTGSLVALILNVFMGLAMGAGVITAKYIGAGDTQKIRRCTHTAMLLSVISGISVGVIGFFISGLLLQLMNVEPAILALSTLYLKIYFLGAPGMLIYNFGAAIVRSHGDTQRPLYILVLSGFVNIVLNLILVIPVKLGVSGVAIATVVSQYISAALIVIYLLRSESVIKINAKELRIYKKELLEIVKIGVPAGIQNSMFSIANVIIQSSVNSFGENAMAGIAAGSNYDSYIYTCTNAFAQTTMTFTSQNVGAKKYENIRKIYGRCLILVCAIAGLLSLIGFIFRSQIVGIFSDVPEVIDIGAERMHLIMPFYIMCSLQDVVAGQIRGLGKSSEPMLVSLLGTCGVRLLWIFVFLPMNRTIINLFIAYPLSWTITCIAQAVLYAVLKKNLMKNQTRAENKVLCEL